MVFNEPETSLHPSLIAPLARLMKATSRNSQIILVSHSATLVAALNDAGALTHALTKELSETHVPEAEPVAWAWPDR